MYKCKECGTEYEKKPDFCDCGNDEFEEIVVKTEVDEIQPVQKEEIKPVSAKEFVKETKIKTHKYEKKSFAEQYPEMARLKASIDPISLTIFLICILLSFVVIFFAWNPQESTLVESEIKQETVKNIPPIDNFWNNAVPKIEEPQKKAEPIKEIVEKILPVAKPVTQDVVKQLPKKTQAVKQTTPKTTTVKLTKTNNISTVQQSQAKAQEKAKQEAEAKTKKEAELKAKQEAEQKAKLEAEAKAKREAEQRANRSAAAKQELAAYKTNLRNTLGYKIDFTKVVGDGSCTVAFKINSSGQLVNRSFAKQSTNITLNDAVYKAIMSTPKVAPPPVVYNNETLNLYIKFYNGNFEITLK